MTHGPDEAANGRALMHIKLNLKLLGCLLAATAVLAVGVHFLHGFQVKRHARGLVRLADWAQEHGRPDRAARALSHYLALVPDDTDTRVRLANLLEERAQTPGARQQALDEFEHVLLRDSGRHDVRRKAAALAVRGGQIDRAQTHLEVLQRAFPKDAEVKNLAGQCYAALKDYQRAEEQYRAAIAAAPTSVDSYVRLALLLRRPRPGSGGTSAGRPPDPGKLATCPCWRPPSGP